MAHVLLVLSLQIRSSGEPDAAQGSSVERWAECGPSYPSRGSNGLGNMGGRLQGHTQGCHSPRSQSVEVKCGLAKRHQSVQWRLRHLPCCSANWDRSVG